MKNRAENILRVLSTWLTNTDSNINEYDGHVEKAIKYAKVEVKQEIADLINEIMDLSDERILEELPYNRKEEGMTQEQLDRSNEQIDSFNGSQNT